MNFPGKSVMLGIVLLAAGMPRALACATCYGASDSPLAQGMNWGILLLLACIGAVLLAVVGFFVFIIRRAHLLTKAAGANVLTESKS